MSKLTAWSALLLMLGMSAAWAQEPASAQSPAAAAADVATPDAIIQAVYSVISGPKGAARDWPRLRSLMAPGGIFAVTSAPSDGPLQTRVLPLEDFISRATKGTAAEPFYEHGVMGTQWRYAHIATVTSPYESRHAPGEAPFARGINTFQLSFDGNRWWIVSISWEAETAAFPLPAKDAALLKSK